MTSTSTLVATPLEGVPGSLDFDKVKVLPVQRYALRTKEAAEFIGMHEDTLRMLRVKGNGPAFRRRGATVLYRIEDLIAWIDEIPASTGPGNNK